MQEENTQAKTENTDTTPKPEKNTGMAVVAYFLFFIPLLTESKNDAFVRYHVKQGFTLFITAILASILYLVPIFMVLGMLLNIAVLILLVIGIMNALGGKEEQLPIIGKFADKAPF